MAKRVVAMVEPALLAWARESAGYSIEEVARKLRKSPDAIKAWEFSEGSRPFMGQLRKLANIYKRSLSDFYLPEPPVERPIPHDFRRAPGEVALVYSPSLRRQLRLARDRRELALALYEDIGEDIPSLKYHISQDADSEAVGAGIRRLLAIDFEQQRKWGEGRPAYHAWRMRIEALGVLVLQIVGVAPEEAFGFSIVENILPVIGVNNKLAPNGRTFTMLHELVHVLRGKSGICDIDDISTRGADEMKVEVFCNRVAAATLMPRGRFLAHETVTMHETGSTQWSDDEIRAIARTFGVSREAVVRRLETVGLTTREFYLHKRRQYGREREEQRRRKAELSRERPVKRNMPHEAIANLGRQYVDLVLHNYNDERITLMDASQYLGVRAEKVRSVERLMAKA